jgi:hypothetical protein
MKKASIAGAVAGTVLVGLLVYYNACIQPSPWPPHDGQLRQTVEVNARELRRGGEGTVALKAIAHYTTAKADAVEEVTITRFGKVEVALVDAAKKVTPVASKGWSAKDGLTTGKVTLPEVPDGDYHLRVTYRTKLGPGEVDVPLPLYTPARIHVITDRPLYEPGNLVRFRAVVLRARDLVPLDGRPGMWVVKNPEGETLLEEKAPAGPWGVVAGTFPLDGEAATGDWKVSWVSADATDEVPFHVAPFTLPRFRVEATADKPYYRPREQPTLRGSVTYSSGAPVSGADLVIQWESSGDWPPPTEWMESVLPKTGKAGANGRFELALPAIPNDLQGQATLTARIAAVDPAGDRVESSASVLLSADGIAVSAVTELGEGLMQGFNNRVYVRVTTPDGVVVPLKKINVKRAWQGDDKGIEAQLDEDGVASLQLDPGPPVNVIIPARPYRPSPRAPLVTRGEPEEIVGHEGASLADQIEMDRWLAALSPCAVWYEDESATVELGLRVSPAGALVVAGDMSSPLARCAAGVLRGKRLPAGAPRMYSMDFTFTDADLPNLTPSVSGVLEVPEGLDEQLHTLGLRARGCLPRDVEGDLPRIQTWSVRAGEKVVRLGDWIDEPDGGDARAAQACAQGALTGATIAFENAFDSDAMGLVHWTVELPVVEGEERPQPTTMIGYELLVTADVEGAPSTKLRLSPGDVPDLRLRLSPVLARVGETVTAELIRGPNFANSGLTLPKQLVLYHLKGEQKADLSADRKATFTIEPGTEGWCQVTAGGVRALVYVRPENDLTVALKPEQERYAPGDQARFALETQLGGKGAQAAVGLIGVDESLGQLVPLPGVDAMARLRPPVETPSPAFGTLDGQALTLGKVRGANAAAATVLRVGAVPSAPELDAVVSVYGATHFDPIEELTDRFYIVLAELHVQVRQWEANAPAGTMMRPPVMADLWKKALAACEARGEKVNDAFGRKLRLHRLPSDLLALTDPRVVVVVGTRLPEDVENWPAWVEKEKP